MHRKVHRPWGWYESIDEGGRFNVKLIELGPMLKTSAVVDAKLFKVLRTTKNDKGVRDPELRQTKKMVLTLHSSTNGTLARRRITAEMRTPRWCTRSKQRQITSKTSHGHTHCYTVKNKWCMPTRISGA